MNNPAQKSATQVNPEDFTLSSEPVQAKKQEPRLMDRVRNRIRIKHYSRSTEQTYVYWILQYIFFHGKRHPQDLREKEIETFLSHLAQQRHLSASSQNQAFCAILFLYREILDIKLSEQINAVRAKTRYHLPTVLTVEEVNRVFSFMTGTPQLMAKLLYGSGLRLNECLQLRIKDVDFARKQVTIFDSKSQRDRASMLPVTLFQALQEQIEATHVLHDQDLKMGYGSVVLPGALHKKYPSASQSLGWQYLFPARNLFKNPKTGARGRWHIDEGVLQRSVRDAARMAGIYKHVTPHCFRHSFATHLLEANYNIRAVQDLLGHKSVETTMTYTHLMNKGASAIVSPLDRFEAAQRPPLPATM